MASTYTLISSNVLSSSAASVTFSSIPSTYTDLVVRWSARRDAAGFSLSIYYNGNNTSSLYSETTLRGSGTAASSSRASSYPYLYSIDEPSTYTASTFGSGELYIPSYTASQNKPASLIGTTENNATASFIETGAGLWSSTSAITSISFYIDGTGNFISGSSFYLYGISKN